MPVSPFQRKCLALDALLPHSSLEPGSRDWLDSDLTEVLTNKAVKLEFRTSFTNLLQWTDAREDELQSISVYTDGSASQAAMMFNLALGLSPSSCVVDRNSISLDKPLPHPWCLPHRTI